MDVDTTAAWIASVQLPTGAIPWFPGGHLDPWDHVQSAMGLAEAGLHDEALAAYDWLARAQRSDGSWAIKYWPGATDDGIDPSSVQAGAVEDGGVDANYCAHLAVGLWHLHQRGVDVSRFWSTLEKAMAVVLALQSGDGPVWWARSAAGEPLREALITGNSSICQSLRCAAKLADALGHPRPQWECAADAISRALIERADLFTPKPRFSMDWYYPVLAGVMTGQTASARIDERWDEFVVPGFGARCVTVNPWVTGGETCELVLALARMGRIEPARQLFADIQHLRDPDGSWWTGLVYEDDVRWPVEQSTWTAGTAILAAAELAQLTVSTV